MGNIIEEVLEATKSGIYKVSRSIVGKKTGQNPELVVALSKLVDSFSKLVVSSKDQPEELSYHEQLEKNCLKEPEEEEI